ncbi:winged helix-turn-helix transcriptional regulator [Celeribacter sp. ULVN23_4]
MTEKSDDIVRALPPRRPDQCAVEEWLSFLGHRWNALVLWQLTEGARRYSELRTRLPGISPKVLSERLLALTERGLVRRQSVNSFPKEVSYALTEAGHEVQAILSQLYELADQCEARPESEL